MREHPTHVPFLDCCFFRTAGPVKSVKLSSFSYISLSTSVVCITDKHKARRLFAVALSLGWRCANANVVEAI